MEPDFPVDPVVANNIDINTVLGRILNPITGQLNRPAPNINVGSPLVPQDDLRQSIARALGTTPPPLRNDQQSSVLGRIGAMLMQPRQQGQSVAGNIGAAVNAGSQMSDAMRNQNQATAMKQAELGSSLATADMNRRTAEANLQILATKFPVEFAELQQRLRKATLEGKAAEVDAIKAELAMADGAKRIVDSMNTAQKKAEADVRNVESTAKQHDAQSAYLKAQAEILLPAHAEAYRGLNKPDAVTVIDAATGRVMVRKNDGTIDYVQITPGVQDPTQARTQAEKELKAEKEQEARDKGRWRPYSWTADTPTKQEVDARAAQIMKGKVEVLHTDTSGRRTSTTPTTSTGAPVVASGPDQPGRLTPTAESDAARKPLDDERRTILAKGKSATEADKARLKAINKQLRSMPSPSNFPVESQADNAQALQRQISALELELNDPELDATTKTKIPGEIAKAKAKLAKMGVNPTETLPDGRTVTVLGGTPGNVQMPRGNANIVASAPQASDVLPHERGRMQENQQIPGIFRVPENDVMPDTIRTLLNKQRHSADELLVLESMKDSEVLTKVERAKIQAALKRGRI